MVRNIVIFLFMLFSFTPVSSQDLGSLLQKEQKAKKVGMTVLGGWSAINIVSSPFLALNTTGSDRYFYAMNGYWNTVNLALSVSGLNTLRKQDLNELSSLKAYDDHKKFQTVFLVNAALDLAYISSGFYLIEKSKSVVNKPERLEGFGQSLILQGSFLFLFDGIMYSVLSANNSSWLKVLDHLELSSNGAGVKFVF